MPPPSATSPAPPPSLTQAWLRQNLALYPPAARDLVYADVDAALAHVPTLRPKTDIYTYDDGRALLLLCLHGLLPISFRRAAYNIPVALWLPLLFPREPPIVYVVPTADMLVRPADAVDVSGKCDLQYIRDWSRKPDSCSLSILLDNMRLQFSRQPPLYSKPRSQPVTQPPAGAAGRGPTGPPSLPPKPPSVAPASPSSPPPAHAPVSPAPPPVPPHPHAPSASPGPPPYAPWQHVAARSVSGTPATRWVPPNAPLPAASTYGQSQPSPVPAASSHPPPPPRLQPQYHAHAPVTAHPPPPPPPPPQPTAVPNLLDADDADDASPAAPPASAAPAAAHPAPPRPPNPELLALHARVHAKLAAGAAALFTAHAADAERQRGVQRSLLAGAPAVRDEAARLAAVRDVCRAVAARLADAVGRADANVQDLRRKGDPEVDELVCSTSIVHNQLVNLVAEDNAIEDTVYHLHRALNAGRIDLERFLRTTRVLAEEQFTKRALIEKILNGMPMGVALRSDAGWT